MGRKMFDYVIGNPPYQEDKQDGNETYSPPVYDKFLEAAYSVSEKVEMVHPARFLFRAGRTPKAWNEKMLSDAHFKVEYYEPDATKLFSTTDIKGGVVISYHDETRNFGAIGTFTQYECLNSIMRKIPRDNQSITEIIYIQNRFDLPALYFDHPEYRSSIGSEGKDSRFEKNIFEKIPSFTKEKENDDDVLTTGIYNNKRIKRYIPRKYVDVTHKCLGRFKIIIPVANGNGEFGSVLGGIEILGPEEAYTRSFIGIGAVETKYEVLAIHSYLKTKFLRTLLSVLKVTQMNNKDVWKYVPLQNFTPSSDIDWSKSIHEIDLQLYRKYGLSLEEIEFIETHVKEIA